MNSNFKKFVLLGGLMMVLCVAIFGSQRDSKAKSSPLAVPPATTSRPATHFTQGTIASIDANQVVVNRKVRGKAQQDTFLLNSQTQRSGNLTTGTRVSIQYRDQNNQKTATVIREVAAKAASRSATKSGKHGFKAGSKS